MMAACPVLKRRPCRPAAGFTLIELAVALVVVAVLLGAILIPLQTQVAQRKMSETQSVLSQATEALIGFALANGHLPCPDKTTGAGAGTPNDGREDVAGGNCVVNEGNLPWVTLGITAATDAWGNYFRYHVTSSFAQRAPTALTLASAGAISVLCPAPACSPAFTYTTTAPAVVLSHGSNGRGAVNASTATVNTPPTSADELQNSDGNTTFVTRPPAAAGAPSGEFDDVVTWISVPLLHNRMVAAGRLP